MITFLAAAAITFAPIVPHGSLDTVAIAVDTPNACTDALLAAGYHGDPTDGAETIYAPLFAVNQLCA